MSILVRVNAMSYVNIADNSSIMKQSLGVVNHMQFDGNPMCTPVGKLSMMIGIPSVNNLSMSGERLGMYDTVFHSPAQVKGLNRLWLTEDGGFQFNQEPQKVKVDTLPNLLEHLKKQFAPIPCEIKDFSEFIPNNMHVMLNAMSDTLRIMELIVFFDPVEKQEVEFFHVEPHWMVHNHNTGNAHMVNLKMHQEEVFTVNQGSDPISISLHQPDGDIKLKFNKVGHLIDITDDEFNSLKGVGFKLDVKSPIFQFLEMDEEPSLLKPEE